jgi:thioredoxin-like negative regulator of GroEL
MDGPVAAQDSAVFEPGAPQALRAAGSPARNVVPETERPRLFFFYGRTSGLSRRVEAYLAQVLQRHRNHSTFRLIRVAVEEHQELAERFKVTELPTLVVVDGTKAKARIVAPRDRASIENALSPWLR